MTQEARSLPETRILSREEGQALQRWDFAEFAGGGNGRRKPEASPATATRALPPRPAPSRPAPAARQAPPLVPVPPRAQQPQPDPPAPAAAVPESAPVEHPAFVLPTAEDIERIHAEAQREGHEAGYAEGLAKGREVGLAEARAQGERFVHMVAELDTALKEMDRQVGDELLALALELARQVVREELALRPEHVAGVVREALGQFPQQHALVCVHPEDATWVRQHLGDLLHHGGHRIAEDPGIARGGCRLESSGSQLDATLPTRWRRVVESLGMSDAWQSEPDA